MNLFSETAAANQSQLTARPARSAIWIAWVLLVISPTAVIYFTPALTPRWALMWLISAAIYYSFKFLSWATNRRPTTTTTRQVAWWLAWVGMDPAQFLSLEPLLANRRPAGPEWLRALIMLAIGATLCAMGLYLIRTLWNMVAVWCGMFGIVFLLHFGLFHLLSCGWRAAGVNAQPIMDRPFSSRSAGEFWGRRWNRAFRDASYSALFKPIARRFSPTAATLAVFIFSGIVHELAVSVPAQAGYGLPTLYFLLQAAIVLLENSAVGKQFLLGQGYRGQALTLVTVFLPLPILFHPPFVRNVMGPFLQFISNL